MPRAYCFPTEPDLTVHCPDDIIDEYRKQFPHVAFLDSSKVTYRSLHGGGPMLNSRVFSWLTMQVGERDDGRWTWFGNKGGRTEFAFRDEGDAAHFMLVWGGNDE